MTRSTFIRLAAVAAFTVALVALLANIPGQAAPGRGARPGPASPRVAEVFAIAPVSAHAVTVPLPRGRPIGIAAVAYDEQFGIFWPIQLELRDARGKLIALQGGTTLALLAVVPARAGTYTAVVRNVLPWPVVAYLWTN